MYAICIWKKCLFYAFKAQRGLIDFGTRQILILLFISFYTIPNDYRLGAVGATRRAEIITEKKK